jgi:hypothetical protein
MQSPVLAFMKFGAIALTFGLPTGACHSSIGKATEPATGTNSSDSALLLPGRVERIRCRYDFQGMSYVGMPEPGFSERSVSRSLSACTRTL